MSDMLQLVDDYPGFHSHRGFSPVYLGAEEIRNRLNGFPIQRAPQIHRAKATV